jgi:uncharacterized delta-60 repeat protein
MTNITPSVLGNASTSGSVVRNYLAAGLIGLLLVSTMMRTVEAADGDLDTTFGSGGIVRSNFFFNAIAIQSDGRMIAAGGVSTFDFALARYNINGSLDPTFGSGGTVTTHFPTVESVRALAIQGDGNIIATGILGNLARYTSDGSLDATFGAGGKVKADIDVFSVAIQSNGKIVIAGDIGTNPGDTDFALARYNADGSPDLTFGLGGKVVTAFSSSYDFGFDVVIQNDGKIVAVGYSNNAGSFALARYNVDGNLDPTFGSGGKVQAPSSPFLAAGQAATLQQDGKILVAGVIVNQNTSYDFALARYNSDGSLDQTFGSGGYVTTDFFNGDDLGTDVALQADGKIIVVGQIKTSSRFDEVYHFGLARYTSAGSLDATFGSGGKVTTIVSNDGDRATGVAIQSDGRIVVAGQASNSDLPGVLARYNNVVFDTCLQDDSNGSILMLNSITGDYLFTTCSGLTIGGTGTVIKRGGIISLQHYAADRRVLAKIDTSANKATAAIQILSQGMTFTITDRNTANNSCVCTR